jgi:hypothetical protein
MFGRCCCHFPTVAEEVGLVPVISVQVSLPFTLSQIAQYPHHSLPRHLFLPVRLIPRCFRREAQ